MRSRHRHVPAAALFAAALFGFSLLGAPPAQAQGYRIGNTLIPDSSIEYPGDAGIWAHTYLQIYIGPHGRGVGFNGGLGPGGGLSPAQLRQAYNLPSTGGSQIIAIVDAYDDPNALADFNTFSAQFGLPKETSTNATASTNKVFQVVYGNGSRPTADSSGGWELEESLDIEWAHAMAPNAKIVLFEALDSSFTNLLGAEQTAAGYTDGNGLTVKEISNSWGSSEFSGENTYDSYFSGTTAAYFVSAGDSGAPAEYPSASPYVVSVGGSTVNTDNSGNFTSETGWSGGGGGPSAYETRPSFQSAISSIVGAKRGTPDITSAADPNTGGSVYDSYPYSGFVYGWVPIGGTSWSSPTLAGIANLAATAAGSFPAGSQALLTTIYSNLGTSKFRDIISGNNGYSAGVGWDFVTGVGSCQGLTGLQASSTSAPAITSLSPSSATAGGASFTLTVNGSGFVSGSKVDWNGTALTTTYVSSTQVTATVPASDIATAGTASVTVVNGSTVSNAETFTINSSRNPVPKALSISPSSAKHGSATVTITITGTGFVSSSQVKWSFGGTTTALTTTYVSSTKVTAVVPSSLLTTAGTASVTVVNPAPGGGTSNVRYFSIR
jgi:subtilase family serine protease